MSTATLEAPDPMLALAAAMSAAAKPAGKVKDHAPTVQLDPAMREKALRLLAVLQYEKDLEAEKNMLKADLSVAFEAQRIALSRSVKKYVGCVQSYGAQYLVKNQYSPIGKDRGEDLLLAFGESFNKFFVKKETVTLELGQNELLDKLLRQACPDKIKTEYKPTETFHHAATLDPEVQAKAAACSCIKVYGGSFSEAKA